MPTGSLHFSDGEKMSGLPLALFELRVKEAAVNMNGNQKMLQPTAVIGIIVLAQHSIEKDG